jgi:hypothetical protein
MATLSASEISADTLEAFKADVPALSSFSTDMSSARAVLNSQIISHISVLPTVQAYSVAGGGFGNGATGAQNLLQDVAVTMSQLPVVPTAVAYLQTIASQKDLYVEAIRNKAYVLGKYIIDYCLTFINGAGGNNFSNKTIQSTANTDVGTIEHVRSLLNLQHAATKGRFAIISTPFAEAVQDDQRMMSALFYNMRNSDSSYRIFRNVAGFSWIYEYPDFPTNGINLNAIFADRRAFTVATRVPELGAFAAANVPNVPPTAVFNEVQDPNSGLTLLDIMYIVQGTFDFYSATTLLFGVTAGNQGTGAGQKTDNAAVYVTTA